MADQITMKQFENDRLPSYPNGGSARKAIIHFTGWSDEMKARARKLIDAKFGAPTVQGAKPAGGAKRGPGRPKKDVDAPVKSSAGKRGPGRPKKETAEAAAPKRGPGRPKKSMDAPIKAPKPEKVARGPRAVASAAAPKVNPINQEIEQLNKLCSALSVIHNINPTAATTEAAAHMTGLLVDCSRKMLEQYPNDLNPIEVKPRARKAAAVSDEAPVVKSNGSKETETKQISFADIPASVVSQI
jgi:hypothetical protein